MHGLKVSRVQLSLLVIGPLLALVLVAVPELRQRQLELKNFEALEARVALADETARLARSLRTERGLSCAVAGSGEPQISARIALARSEVESQFVVVRELLAQTPRHESWHGHDDAMDDALGRFSAESLQTLRRKVDDGSIDVLEILDGFGTPIGALDTCMASVSRYASPGDLRRVIDRCAMLVQEQELAGHERAIFSHAFSKKLLSPELRSRLVILIHAQDAVAGLRHTLDSERPVAMSTTPPLHEASKEPRAMRRSALELGDLDQDVAEWFRAQSAWIDHLAAQESMLRSSIHNETHALANLARRQHWYLLSLLLVIGGAAPILGGLLAANIHQRFNKLGSLLNERLELQSLVRESRNQLAGILETASDAVICLDDDLKLIRFNRSAEATFGLGADDVLGKHINTLLPERFHDGHAEKIYSFGHSSPSSRLRNDRTEVVGLRADGTEFPADISISHLSTKSGSIYTATLRDISEQKEAFRRMTEAASSLEGANERLVGLNDDKNRFLGIAAHDLRSPLSAILGYASVMEGGLAGELNVAQNDMAEKIKHSAEFMLHLVNELLDISAIESGKLELQSEVTNMNTLLDLACRLLEPTARAKDITIKTRLDEPLTCISVDPVKMEQVIHNLLTNAIKFSSAGSNIEVGTRQRGDNIEIYVADEGPGIALEEQRRLFEPFQTASTRATGGEKSTGLGLAIVKKIVDGHSGEIRVKSAPRKGATFFVSLPLHPDTSQASAD